ncbi:MAG: DNA adenine methylase [Prevotellaceae bacterium]|nr:DNA adenine methylase [Prevotellaceae bacterium]
MIYNDYDGYCNRLTNIGHTNELLRYCRSVLKDYPRGKRIAGKPREDILRRFARAGKRGVVDWITASSYLCFSMKYATSYEALAKGALHNRVRLADYSAAGYIDGLEVVRTDYKQLCEQYRGVSGALFIADPPYLSTDSSTYTSDGYWQLKDYLNVLAALVGLQFVYFTSNKSQILELLDWINGGGDKARYLFRGAAIRGVKSHSTHRSSYNDLMITNAVKSALN